MELPRPTMAALVAYRELTDALSQWASTVHELVRERISTLMDADGLRRDTPTETAEQYTQRVLAHGQYPFPKGECLYDDLNCNRGYDHIKVGYGVGSEEGGARITYSGRYPVWAPDGESYTDGWAEIHCPAWLVTDPDGIARYRQQTTEMVAAVRAERAAEHAQIETLLERAIAERSSEKE